MYMQHAKMGVGGHTRPSAFESVDARWNFVVTGSAREPLAARRLKARRFW
jgi:hypothetical protein